MQELESSEDLKEDELRSQFIDEIIDALKDLDKKAKTNAEHHMMYLLATCLNDNIEFCE